jgi:predicted alpha/beta-hydrolase family hydrolase
VVEPSSRFEELTIPLPEPVHGLGEVSAVLGIPRWWPTGSRVSVVLAHDQGADHSDPLIEYLHRELTERRCLCLRFNFPFAEARKRRPDAMPVLRRCFRAAMDILTRDPGAAPARVFLGGKGLGGQVAAEVASARVRVDGLFLLGYPLHPQGQPQKAQPEQLFRIVSPLLFVQGTRDRRCDLDTLRRVLRSVGAPTALQVVEEADKNFNVLKKSRRSAEEVREELLSSVDGWIQKVMEA